MSAPAPFPWDRVLAFGLGTLRMDPAAFWGATPREILALAGGTAAPVPPDRAALDALLDRFPDGRRTP